MRRMAIAPGKVAGQGTVSVVAGFYWLASSPYFWSTSRGLSVSVLKNGMLLAVINVWPSDSI